MIFPIPFTATEYGAAIVAEVASTPLLVWSHIVTAVIGIIFALFIYHQTKKLSSFYLLLSALCFAIWAYFDLITWGAPQEAMMFLWSLLDIFSVLFSLFAYWFLYAFIKGTDLPFKHKVLSLALVVPVYIYTLTSWNMSAYSNTEINALESDITANASLVIEGIFIMFMIALIIHTLRTSRDATQKKKAVLGGIGAILLVSIFVLSFVIANTMLILEVGPANEAYNVGNYALFGMPLLAGLLGYLVAKYQAFDLKLTKTVGMVVLLVLLLFLSLLT
jgi:hypothetical protein